MVTINWGGFVHPKVKELFLTVEEDAHWDRSGDYGIVHGPKDLHKLGANHTDGLCEFISTDKKEAEAFLAGALATKKFLLDFLA